MPRKLDEIEKDLRACADLQDYVSLDGAYLQFDIELEHKKLPEFIKLLQELNEVING